MNPTDRCTCEQTVAAHPIHGPSEWEQNPDCPVHPWSLSLAERVAATQAGLASIDVAAWLEWVGRGSLDRKDLVPEDVTPAERVAAGKAVHRAEILGAHTITRTWPNHARAVAAEKAAADARTAASTARLYGTVGAEVLYDSIAEVYELCIDGQWDGTDPALGPWKIEAWTIRPAIDSVPAADDIVERLVEQICDGGEFTEDPFPDNIHKKPELLAAAEALRQALVKEITWQMADQRVAVHELKLVGEGDGAEPYIDGEPLYRKAPA